MIINSNDRILFLDDAVERIETVRQYLPEAVIVTTAKDCITQLKENVFDQVFLDHDLDGPDNALVEDHGNGMDVVRWIIKFKPKIWGILVHSMNGECGPPMAEELRKNGFNSIWYSYEWLKNDLISASQKGE